MTDPKNDIKLRSSAVTNVGRVRNHNEDNIHLWTNDELLLAIVADGMGGAAAGEEASRIAVETIMASLPIHDDGGEIDIPDDELTSAVMAANVSIIKEAVDHPRQRGMGTTLTMVFVKGNFARFAHVGDSRAYRVNKYGEIEQITSDHSFVQALLDAGHITEEQAETHPMGNVLYRALGQTQDLDVDTYHAVLDKGDTLVLCSDGLTRHVRAREIAEIASQMQNPNMISQKLVDMANERGGEDNISVITVVIDSEEKSKTFTNESLFEKDDDDTLILKSPSDKIKHPSESSDASGIDQVNHRESYERMDRRSPPMSPPQNSLSQNITYEGQDPTYPK